MFELIHFGGPYSDGILSYQVKLNDEYTVGEFIHDVTSSKGEWGYIGIFDRKSLFGDPSVQYHDGHIIGKFPEEYLKLKVTGVSAYGEWSRMDYLLEVENFEKEEVE